MKNSVTIIATGISDTEGGRTSLVTDSMNMKKAMRRLRRQIPPSRSRPTTSG